MNWKLLMSGLLLSGGLLISGCSMLPSPGSTIMAPQANTAVKEFLPLGSKLEEPRNPAGGKAIQQQDMDGDGKAELLATYRVGQNPGKLGAVLLQKKQDKWQKVWEFEEALGIALDHASFADFTGDGRPELLLGWVMDPKNLNGVEHGSMDIFTWQEKEKSGGGGGGVAMDDDGNAVNEVHWEGILTHIYGGGYEKMEVLNPPNQENTGKQAALAVWFHIHPGAEDYPRCSVRRWEKVGSDTGWAPAEDLYPEYCKKFVAFCQENVKEMPEDPFYWFELADFQVKANLPEDALKSITIGEALKSGVLKESHWLIMKGKALNKLEKYEEARSTLSNVIQGLKRENDDDAYCLIMAYFNLGQSYAGLKETDKAKAAYEKSLEIIKQYDKRYNTPDFPLQPLVQRALEKL